MRAILPCILVAGACSGIPQVTKPALPGVAVPAPQAFDPPLPTLRLPTNFAPSRYTARLAIDPEQPKFTGSIEISGVLDRRSAAIWLHAKQLAIATATANGLPMTAIPHADELELRPAQPLPAGAVVLALAYQGDVQPTGTDAGAYLSTTGADHYIVTHFEPTAARLVFPCIDEPGVKVPWQLTLDVRKGLVAASNTPIASETPLDATHVRVAFAPTRPLPSYLVAFGIGPFEIVDAGHAKSGVPLRLLVPKGMAARAAFSAQQLPRIVDALEAWTDIPFPYPKLDIMTRNTSGAMENAGLIMTDPQEVLMDPVHPTATQRHEMIDLMSHETAHQWFGDLVTSAWWDDLWLNESFATLMEDKVLFALEPSWRDDEQRVSRRWMGTNADSFASAHAIRQPITAEGEIANIFDSITYQKGATVLRMFEAALGTDVFQRGIRAYLRARADRTATAADVIAALEAASHVPIAADIDTFLDQPGVPELAVSVACSAGAPARATIAQRRHQVATGPQIWRMPVCLAYETAAHGRGETCTWLRTSTVEIELPRSACPAWVLADANARAYAVLEPGEAQAFALRDLAWPQLTWPERRAIFEGLRGEALMGNLRVDTLMSIGLKLAEGGRDAVGDLLGDPWTWGWGNGMPVGMRGFVPANLLPEAKAFMRKAIAPLAKRLGVTARPGESLDDEISRVNVVTAGAWAGDPQIGREAVALAAHYRDLPTSVRDTILPIAASASATVAAKLRSDILAETDPEVRLALAGALGQITVPDRLAAMLDLALDPKLTPRDALQLLTYWSDESQRIVVEQWLRVHLAELEKRLPASGDLAPELALIGAFTSACEAAARDVEVQFVTEHFAKLPGGARPVAQAIEALDLCIEKRFRAEPELRKWLSRTAPRSSR